MEQGLTLARDDDGWYGIYEDEPEKDSSGNWDGKIASDLIDEASFHTVFGCHPVRKGRKRKIKRILIELEG